MLPETLSGSLVGPKILSLMWSIPDHVCASPWAFATLQPLTAKRSVRRERTSLGTASVGKKSIVLPNLLGIGVLVAALGRVMDILLLAAIQRAE